jgi:hypothetical protein
MFISKKQLNSVLSRLDHLEKLLEVRDREIALLTENLDHLSRVVGGPKLRRRYVGFPNSPIDPFQGAPLWDRVAALPFKFKYLGEVPAHVVAEPKKP